MNLLNRTISLCFFLIIHLNVSGQLCNKKMIRFNFNEDKIISTKKLDSIRNILLTGEYYLELHGHTDLKGTDAYNFQLAQERMNFVKKHLQINKGKYPIHLIEKNYGKTKPLINDTTYQAGIENRRVEIMYFPIIDNKIKLKGKKGSTVEIPWNAFSPCGICASNPRMTEILSEEEANQMNIPLVSEDGVPLITGGMIKFDYDPCGEKKQDSCIEIKAEIPGKIIRRDMTVWESKEVDGKLTWVNTKKPIEYISTNNTPKCGMIINLCSSKRLSNCDVKMAYDSLKIIVPFLKRKDDASILKEAFSEPSLIVIKDTIYRRKSTCLGDKDPHFYLIDKGMGPNKITYQFKDSLHPYLHPQLHNDTIHYSEYIVPLKAYTYIPFVTDTLVYLKTPRRTYESVIIKSETYDTIFDANRHKKSSKFIFLKPSEKYDLLLKNRSDSSVKQLDSSELKMKYKKRRKILKAKMKTFYY